MTVWKSDLAYSKDYGDGNVPKGMVLASKAVFTTASVLQNETVLLNPIPEGATVLDVIIQGSAGTASLSVDVGDGTTVDKFIDGATATAAFMARLSNAGGVGVTYDADGHIVAKFLGAAPDDDIVITCTVLYTM